MLTDEHLNETKIDLGDEQGQPDQHAPADKGQITSVEERDPRGINAHLKVSSAWPLPGPVQARLHAVG